MLYQAHRGLFLPGNAPPNLLEVEIHTDYAKRILAIGERYLDRSDDERFFLCRGGLVHRCHQSDPNIAPTGALVNPIVEPEDPIENLYWRDSTMDLSWDCLFGPDARVDLKDANPRWRVQGIRLLPRLIEGQIARLDEFLHRSGVMEQFFADPSPTRQALRTEDEIGNFAEFREMSYLANLYVEQSFKTIVASIHDVRFERTHRVDELWGIDPGDYRTPMNEAARSTVIKYLHKNPFFRYTEFKINGAKTCKPYPSETDIDEYLREMASQYSDIKYLGFEPIDGDWIELSPAISLRIAIAGCHAAVELARDTGEAGDGS